MRRDLPSCRVWCGQRRCRPTFHISPSRRGITYPTASFYGFRMRSTRIGRYDRRCRITSHAHSHHSHCNGIRSYGPQRRLPLGDWSVQGAIESDIEPSPLYTRGPQLQRLGTGLIPFWGFGRGQRPRRAQENPNVSRTSEYLMFTDREFGAVAFSQPRVGLRFFPAFRPADQGSVPPELASLTKSE
jgi:hypothetical protein